MYPKTQFRVSNTWLNWNYTKLFVPEVHWDPAAKGLFREFYFVLRFPPAFSNVSSNDLPEKRHGHIGCIFFSTVCFQMSPQIPICCRMHNRIRCTCLAFLHCAFANVSPNCLLVRMQSHIGCIC